VFGVDVPQGTVHAMVGRNFVPGVGRAQVDGCGGHGFVGLLFSGWKEGSVRGVLVLDGFCGEFESDFTEANCAQTLVLSVRLAGVRTGLGWRFFWEMANTKTGNESREISLKEAASEWKKREVFLNHRLHRFSQISGGVKREGREGGMDGRVAGGWLVQRYVHNSMIWSLSFPPFVTPQ